MSAIDSVLVLGAYGLAGRTIFDGLLRKTDLRLIAAGRRPEKLQSLIAGRETSRIELLTIDAADRESLRSACKKARLVINAVGPYAEHGADIARIAIDAGCSYLDCANEQIHYRRLQSIDVEAKRKGLLLATAAGVIPGLSTLVAAELLKNVASAASVDIYFAQFQHAYEDAGLGSIMGGVLDAGYRPVAWIDGRETPVKLGDSQRTVEFPAPFGKLRCLEVPTIDALTLTANRPVRHLRSWFYLGEQPTWMFGLIRLLQPHKNRWTYRLIESAARPLNEKEHRRAVKLDFSREALLSVTVKGFGFEHCAQIVLKDGASPMAVIPVRIAQHLLAGQIGHAGLATASDLLTFDQLRNELNEFAVTMEIR